jgi:uncharacterized protein YueI
LLLGSTKKSKTQGAFVEPEALEIFLGVYTDSILCALAFGLTEQESQGNLEKLTQLDCEKKLILQAQLQICLQRDV